MQPKGRRVPTLVVARNALTVTCLFLIAMMGACDRIPSEREAAAARGIRPCLGDAPEAWYGRRFQREHQHIQSVLLAGIRIAPTDWGRETIVRRSDPRQLNIT